MGVAARHLRQRRTHAALACSTRHLIQDVQANLLAVDPGLLLQAARQVPVEFTISCTSSFWLDANRSQVTHLAVSLLALQPIASLLLLSCYLSEPLFCFFYEKLLSHDSGTD
jgi:hypothetical protein